MLAAAVSLLVNCGGASSGSSTGTSASSSTTRTLTGSLAASSNSALVKALTNTSCEADQVIATSVDATTATATVDENCDFSLTLTLGQTYSIAFLLNNNFVASLIFDTGISGFTSSSLSVGAGSGAVNLGTITINGNTAFAEHDALDQMDSDDDGISDLDDSDDDNDGIDDLDEGDCDLDGVIDDYDDDSCDTSISDGVARVREVKPRNDPHTDRGNDRVDLDKEVRARIACEIDPDTVTSDTFIVQSEDSSHIVDCTYDFNSDGNRVSCVHDNDRFELDTVYMATLSGVSCMDGTPVQEVTWYWLSDDEDSGSGCYEDDTDYDDESELEEDNYEDSSDGECSGSDSETDDSCGASDNSDDDSDDNGGSSDDDSDD